MLSVIIFVVQADCIVVANRLYFGKINCMPYAISYDIIAVQSNLIGLDCCGWYIISNGHCSRNLSSILILIHSGWTKVVAYGVLLLLNCCNKRRGYYARSITTALAVCDDMNKGVSRATWLLRVTDQCFCIEFLSSYCGQRLSRKLKLRMILLWCEFLSKVSFNSSSYVNKFNSCPIQVGNATLKISMYHLNLCFVIASFYAEKSFATNYIMIMVMADSI